MQGIAQNDHFSAYASDESSQADQAAVKVPAMIIMFTMTMVFGSIPLRVQAFKENKLVLALANGFSGGLFLAIGLLHLLPEANENFENYYGEGDEDDNSTPSNDVTDGEDDEGWEHFPWAFFISVLSFALILFIEKIAVGEQHIHYHGEDDHPSALRKSLSLQQQSIDQDKLIDQVEESELQEEIIHEALNTKDKLARSFQSNEAKRSMGEKHRDLTPYILQIAVGIHALFEGIAIGIQAEWSQALGVALAVIGHKWAEALTLGIAFRKANIDVNQATIMIAIQAVMNPLGVGLGWILTSQGDLLTGIFTSISVGTFIYIATMEVIVEEFALQRYKVQKFLLFLFAIGFVCCLWVFEQLAGG